MINNVEAMWRNATILSSGFTGTTRVSVLNGTMLVLKRFRDTNQKRFEENVHLTLWNRIKPTCKRYFTEPLKSGHDHISVQHAAFQGNDIVVSFRDLTYNEKMNVNSQLAKALFCSHNVGIVHGDIKLDNMVIIRRGDSVRLKLIDFGMAKVTDAALLNRHHIRELLGNNDDYGNNYFIMSPQKIVPVGERSKYLVDQILPHFPDTRRFYMSQKRNATANISQGLSRIHISRSRGKKRVRSRDLL